MKTIVTITDITRMAPPFVCVAGVADDERNIRIQFRQSRIDEHWLVHNGVTPIRPFARVGFTLLQPRSEPPHTEDWFVDKYLLESLGMLDADAREDFFTSILDPSVMDIFGTEVLRDPGYYVLKGRGNRSLGTIRAQHLHGVSCQCYEETGWDYHLRFMDEGGETYSLKVKDLTFCAYLDHLRETNPLSEQELGERMLAQLSGTELYLRIGLARGWARYPDRCYLQITGVFSFPDYLQGRWFADFVTPRGYQPARPILPSADPEPARVREAAAAQAGYTPQGITPMSAVKQPEAPPADPESVLPPARAKNRLDHLKKALRDAFFGKENNETDH